MRLYIIKEIYLSQSQNLDEGNKPKNPFTNPLYWQNKSKYKDLRKLTFWVWLWLAERERKSERWRDIEKYVGYRV